MIAGALRHSSLSGPSLRWIFFVHFPGAAAPLEFKMASHAARVKFVRPEESSSSLTACRHDSHLHVKYSYLSYFRWPWWDSVVTLPPAKKEKRKSRSFVIKNRLKIKFLIKHSERSGSINLNWIRNLFLSHNDDLVNLSHRLILKWTQRVS